MSRYKNTEKQSICNFSQPPEPPVLQPCSLIFVKNQCPADLLIPPFAG